jgi:hypothetical protein
MGHGGSTTGAVDPVDPDGLDDPDGRSPSRSGNSGPRGKDEASPADIRRVLVAS